MFYVFEIADGVCFELIGGRLITDNNAVGVHLQNTNRPHVIDAAFYRVMNSASLFVAAGDDHNLFGIHNGADADGEHSGR